MAYRIIMTNKEIWLTLMCMVCIFIMLFVSVEVNINQIKPRSFADKDLKCIDGKLFEEVKKNMFVTNHLECFEQRKF
jgi:hypothetical protein